MTPLALFSLFVLAALIAALATNKVAVDVAMLSGLLVLMLAGAVDPTAALAGFAHPSVIMIASLFIVAEGLNQTGAIQVMAQRMLGRPQTVAGAQLRLTAPVALLSAFMNNTPIVAMYLPIVGDWAKKIRISPSKLFMPLSFAAILGGKLTLIGSSSNLVVMGLYFEYAQLHPEAALAGWKQFWGPALMGLPAAMAGIVFMIAASRWLLPERRPAMGTLLDARRYTVQMEVLPGSPIVGRSIEEAGLRHLPGLYLSEVERGADQIPAPSPEFRLQAGDRLSFAGVLESVVDLRRIRGLIPATDQVEKVQTDRRERTLVEAVISHNSPLVNRTVREAKFRTVYNAAIIAVHRNGEQVRAKVGDIRLRPGDTLLLETHRGFVEAYRNSDDFYLVSMVAGSTPVRHDKAWLAAGILAALVALLAFSILPPMVAALLAAIAMIASGCLSAAVARGSLNLQVLLVIAAALGISEALQSTGAAQVMAGTLIGLGHELQLGPRTMVFVVLLTASIFGQMITNNGAAALLFPVTMATAEAYGSNPEPFVFTLMIGAGLSFMTPISYQTNLMVYGPGGYRFLDFARFGIPLTLVTAAAAALACGLVFPF